MSRLSDADQRSLRGQRCPECGHAEAAHNDLGYCQRDSALYGQCPCPSGWIVGVGSVPTWTPEQYAEMRRDQARRVRAARGATS